MKEQTSAEYLREARKRRKMSKRQVGAMMARMCEMQSGILPMWRMSADGHQAALQRMERQSQFCTWEDSRLIAEILQVGEEGANRILTTRDVRTAINHARHISVVSLGGRVAVAIRRRMTRAAAPSSSRSAKS